MIEVPSFMNISVTVAFAVPEQNGIPSHSEGTVYLSSGPAAPQWNSSPSLVYQGQVLNFPPSPSLP